MGLPLVLEDPKYERNAFLFNFGMVYDAHEEAALPSLLEPIIRKTARMLKLAEVRTLTLTRSHLGFHL